MCWKIKKRNTNFSLLRYFLIVGVSSRLVAGCQNAFIGEELICLVLSFISACWFFTACIKKLGVVSQCWNKAFECQQGSICRWAIFLLRKNDGWFSSNPAVNDLTGFVVVLAVIFAVIGFSGYFILREIGKYYEQLDKLERHLKIVEEGIYNVKFKIETFTQKLKQEDVLLVDLDSEKKTFVLLREEYETVQTLIAKHNRMLHDFEVNRAIPPDYVRLSEWKIRLFTESIRKLEGLQQRGEESRRRRHTVMEKQSVCPVEVVIDKFLQLFDGNVRRSGMGGIFLKFLRWFRIVCIFIWVVDWIVIRYRKYKGREEEFFKKEKNEEKKDNTK